MTKLSEIAGRRLPFLRWSAWRMALGGRHLTRHWQVGDGREEALAAYVTSNAVAGDLDDVIRVVDEFCYQHSVMMNVGDEKGQILDAAVRRTRPGLLLELGAYCGYSALRMARVMPPAHGCTPWSSPKRTQRLPGASGITLALPTGSCGRAWVVSLLIRITRSGC